MNLLICGTAAAEGWPALFCACDACVKARALGGKNVRTRAAYMLGERVRIDFGPDSYLHQLKYGLDYSKLEHLVMTHSHDDHWLPIEMQYRRKGFSVSAENTLHLWGNETVRQRFVEANGENWQALKMDFHKLEPWNEHDLGEGLSVIPIVAAHDPDEQCLNLIFEYNGRSVLIGHDTGWYCDETWEFLASRRLDIALIDCTYGPHDHSGGHLGCSWVVKMRDELKKRGSLSAGGRVIATHFSHNGGWLLKDLENYFRPQGIEVAWDGMMVEL